MRTRVWSDRLGRKGVEAIFSTPREGIDARFVIGLFILVIGIITVIIVGLQSQFPSPFGPLKIGSYLSILLSSLGLYLVVVASGICLSYSVFRSTATSVRAQSVDDSTPQDPRISFDPSLGRPKASSDPRGRIELSPNLRFGILAFLQSSIVLALYTGLADEYESNLSMRLWIRSRFPFGQYLLNWWIALILAGVLGLLLVQFLPGRRFAE